MELMKDKAAAAHLVFVGGGQNVSARLHASVSFSNTCLSRGRTDLIYTVTKREQTTKHSKTGVHERLVRNIQLQLQHHHTYITTTISHQSSVISHQSSVVRHQSSHEETKLMNCKAAAVHLVFDGGGQAYWRR